MKDNRVKLTSHKKDQCRPTWQVTFRYYYNPVPNDRRLVMDLGRNLLKPPPGADRDEQARYRPSWP